MFRFYLNNILVKDPENWKDFTETITRSKELNGLLISYDGELSFSGDGYALLYDLYLNSGFCNLVDVVIEQNICGEYENVLSGYIFISDCKFNLSRCVVDCSVIDDNYNARISNNKSIEIYLDSSLSKNLVSITPCLTKLCTFFRPSNGFDIVGLRKVYPVYEALKYFIAFMTDGKVDFASDYLDWNLTQTDNPQRALAITTGAIIRNVGGGASPKISFESLMKEITKKYPIAFTIQRQANGRPLFKLESENYFLGNDSGVSVLNINEVTQTIEQLKLYSEIGIGGTVASYSASIHSLPTSLRMFFDTEQFYFQTQCNIDNQLDLVGQYICDSNIIEELVFTSTGNSSYDTNTFFVDIAYSGGILGNRPIQTVLFPPTAFPVIYNGNLRNSIVAQNFNMYADLISYINSNDIGFMATKTTAYTYPAHDLSGYSYGFGGIISPLQSATQLINYQDDFTPPNKDAGGNYSLTARYTAPINGNYYFKNQLSCEVSTSLPSFLLPLGKNIAIKYILQFRKYDSASTLIETYTKTYGGTFGTTFGATGYKVFANYFPEYFLISGEKMFFLEAGDYVETYGYWISIPFKAYSSTGIHNGSATNASVKILNNTDTYFKTLTTEGNGMLVSGNSSDYNVESLEFERHLDYTNYNILKQDPSKKITISYRGVESRSAWINTAIRTLSTGEMKWKLTTNIDN